MRIIGIDIGERRIGVAVSDPLGITAQGLEVIDRLTVEPLGRLKELAGQYQPEQVVFGLPRRTDGSLGVSAEKAIAFAREVGESLALPVVPWDERLTTREAERLLIGADVRRAKRRKVIDKVAAVLILQGYLDCRK
ncbi:MAG TPA: Holliday junction resolvase RuvX [Spirochaetia bacterium]|nr:Holliday junction resolvase RuvX [Spirochaetia bacterium]